MRTLTIAAPEIVLEDPLGPPVLEKPLTIKCPQPLFPDGNPFGFEHLGAAGKEAARAGLVVRRIDRATNTRFVWDAGGKEWLPDSVEVQQLQPVPLFFNDKERPYTWETVIVPAGEKDKWDMPAYQSAGSNWKYTFQALFIGRLKEDNELTVWLSAETGPLAFLSMIDDALAGIAIGDAETLLNTKEIRMFLRRLPDRAEIGYFKAERDNMNSPAISIVRQSPQAQPPPKPLSYILLKADHSIELCSNTNSQGGQIKITLHDDGNLEIKGPPGKVLKYNDFTITQDVNQDVTINCPGKLTINASEMELNAADVTINTNDDAGNDNALHTKRIEYVESESRTHDPGGRRWLP